MQITFLRNHITIILFKESHFYRINKVLDKFERKSILKMKDYFIQFYVLTIIIHQMYVRYIRMAGARIVRSTKI